MDNEIQDSSYTDSQEVSKADTNTEIGTISQTDFNENASQKSNLEKSAQNKNLYNEFLTQLDIIKNQPKQDNKNPENLNGNKTQQGNSVEKALKQDFDKIQKLVKAGLIDSKQGQDLKKEVLKKAFDKLVQTEKIKRNLQSNPKPENNFAQGDKNRDLEEFSKNNPEFFNPQGRKEVLDYLKSGNIQLGKDDINKISEIIRLVEKSAIDRFLQKVAYEKNLISSNETAKQKLKANAQKTGYSGNYYRAFTREQIGKMSGEEFAKYESAIMDALKKGLIK